MSSFLDGGSPLEKAKPNDALTDFDRKVAQAINNPGVHMLLMQPFMEYVTQYQALNQVPIPISQIFGFTQFAAHIEVVGGTSTTSATSYGDLADGGGPILNSLPDGQYLLIFGCSASNSGGGANCNMSVRINSTEAVDGDSCVVQIQTSFVGMSRAVLKTLSNDGVNSVTTRYRVSGGTGSFTSRWLVALRVGNL